MYTIAIAAVLSLSTLVAPVDGVKTTPHHKFLALQEIMKRMESSPVAYRLADVDKLTDVPVDSFIELLWPLQVRPARLPRIVREPSGRRTIAEWQMAPAAAPLLDEAEANYSKKDYAAAAEKYRAILELDPQFYLVHASLGDCALFSGDAKTALKHYQRAIQINPDDYRPHFYQGNALMALGRKKEAVDSFVDSLMLKPRNPILLDQLRSHAEQLGISVQPDLLAPKAFVRKEGKAIAAYSDKDAPYWLGWAVCKAFWLGEASHREEMTGSPEPGWSTLEDMECLAALVGAYEIDAKKPGAVRNPAIERLEQVLKDGLAGAFVVYELGSRLDPQISLKIDLAFRDVLRRYIRKYVLGLDEK
jgi:tetratricopeptide (TPR) repeat protein